jgi:uncharacterized OB-fold protein
MAEIADPALTQPIADLEQAQRSPLHAGAGEPRLRGSRCLDCGKRFFPVRSICFGCTSRRLEDTPLATAGTLYSFTVVHIAPSLPTPYTVGYVDLEDGVRVFSHVSADPSRLRPDLPVRLVVDGESWSFAPTEEAT